MAVFLQLTNLLVSRQVCEKSQIQSLLLTSLRNLCQEWKLNKVTYQKLAEIGVLGELQEELCRVKVFLP